MKVVFISGPFRGKNAWEVEQNIRRAEELALRVAELGFVPVCIHTMYRYFAGTVNDDFWVKACNELLLRSDAVLFEENWMSSSGSGDEKKLCQQEDKPFVYTLEKLVEWREEQDARPE